MIKIEVNIDPKDLEAVTATADILRRLSDGLIGTTPKPAKAEPAKVEEAKAEPAKVEEAKAEPAKVEEAKAEPAKVEEAKAEPAKPTTRKRPSRAKVKTTPEEQTEDESTEQTEDESTEEDEDDAKEVESTEEDEDGTYTLEDVRVLLNKKVGNHKDALRAKINELGGAKVSELKKSTYATLYAFMEELS